jgi:hypothetical protein
MKTILLICATVILSGCAGMVQKNIEATNTLAKIAGRNLGYRSEQAKAMMKTQLLNDPLMSADMADLVGLMTLPTGLFNTELDKSAQAGFEDGVNLFRGAEPVH